MFGIKSKAQCIKEADQYMARVRPALDELTGRMEPGADQAMAEIFGGIFLLSLGFAGIDSRNLRPYVAERFAASMKYFRIEPADLPKRLQYISACWDEYDAAKKKAAAQKKNPVIAMLNCAAGKSVCEIIEKNAGYKDAFHSSVNLLIDRLGLKEYEHCVFPVSAPASAPVPKPAPASAPKSAPASAPAQQRMVLRNERGETVEFAIVDTIAYQNQTYVCLRDVRTGENKILRVVLRPDGTTAYGDPGPVMGDIVMELAKKRNPIDAMPGGRNVPKTISLKNEHGKQVNFEVMDVIPHQGRTFVCLLGEGEELLTVLETKSRPDGSASYLSVDDRTTQQVFELFCRRNPDKIG